MIFIGQKIRGCAVRHILGQQEAGRPCGAYILVELTTKDRDPEFVVGFVRQTDIDSDAPVKEWAYGHYFVAGPPDERAGRALRYLLEASGLIAFGGKE